MPKTLFYIIRKLRHRVVSRQERMRSILWNLELAAGPILFHSAVRSFLNMGNSSLTEVNYLRRKGFTTEMLRQLLEVAKKAGMNELYLSVEKKNEPSVKTIIRNGGVYQRSFEMDGEQADIYRIALSK